MANVSIGAKGILWAVPLEPINLFKAAFPTVPHQHITLWFGCDRSEVSQYVGMIFSATIAGHAMNENIQAATVILPAGIPFHHDRPHITLSHSEGTLPMESTQMIKDSTIESVATIATFRIEFFQFS